MSTYHSKNPSLTRSGSAPRTICYTQSVSARSFNYQSPKNLNIDLKGNLNKKIILPETKEEVVFRRLNKKEEPNTNRTLVPSMAPEPQMIRSSSSKNLCNPNYNPGNLNALICKTEANDTRNKRTTNPKVYRSFRFDDDSSQEPYRRKIKEGVFKVYDSTTQIVALPGGVKRQTNDIRDDTLTPPLKSKGAHSVKLLKDYNSSIACLPGKLQNIQDEKRVIKERKFQSSDIFNLVPTNNYNSFNVSNRKVQNTNRIFGQSNEEKKLIPNPLAHRPRQMRDIFVSQISIV